MSAILLTLPAELGAILLKAAVAKYIEGAGTSAEMVSRAAAVKAVATMLDQAALGTISLTQLASMTEAELTSAKMSVSTQILVNGLVQVVTAALPLANSGLITAALGAQANVFLQDVISVCGTFGA